MRTTHTLTTLSVLSAGIGGGMTLVGIPWLGGVLACAGAIIGVAAISRSQEQPLTPEPANRETPARNPQLMGRVFGALDDGLVVQDPTGMILDHNAAAERILGLTGDQIRGRSSLDPRWRCIREDGSDFPGVDHPAMVTLRTGKPLHQVVMGVHRADGSLVWISITSQPIPATEHDPIGVVCTFTDITERRARTEALIKSEGALRELGTFQGMVLDSAHVMIITTDVQGTILHFNRTAERLLGWSREEMVGKRNPSILHVAEEVVARAAALTEELREPIAPGFAAFVAKVQRQGGVDENDWTYVTKDGQKLSVRLSVTALRDPQGVLLGWMGTALDLTAHRRAEEEVNRFFQVSLDLLVIFDMQGNFRRVNPAWTKFLGWRPDELLGKSFAEFLHTDDLAPTSAEVTKLGHGQMTINFLNRYRHRDGTWRTLQWHCSPDGPNHLLYAGAQDVTDNLSLVEELRLARGESLAKAEQLQLALVSSGTGMWDWHVATGAVHLSPTWFIMRGFAVNELPQCYQTWANLVHPDDFSHVQGELQAHMAGQRPYDLSYRSRRKDGTWQWIQERGEVVHRDGAGNPLRMLGTNADITELKTLMEGLDAARITAESAAQAKSDFLATMSHEIRTPMNGVIGLTSVLLAESLDPSHRQIVQTIQRSGETLLAILNDILDLAKIESGKMDLRLESVDAGQVIRDALLLFTSQAAAKGLTLQLDPDAPRATWLADPIRIRQVVLNLISNALKFTEKGGVRLNLTIHGERLRLAVIDTGIGIPADRIDHLFQRFVQIDSQSTRRQGGTGLGLAISKHLIGLMAGTISVTSTPEVGSSFTIDLPMVHGSSSRHHLIRTPLPSDLRPLRILVAEDNKVNQIVARKMLEQLGHTMVLAENGVQAVTCWAAGEHDLILMDWQMPELDGLDATRQIRHRENQENRRRIPIIAMTANALDGDRETCLAAGMDDVLAKPVTRERLAAALAGAMRS